MSYGLEYGHDVAARAQPSARAMFIRNTYAHLAGAVLAFIGIEAVLLSIPGLGEEVTRLLLGARLTWLLVIGAFMLVSFVANRWAQSDMPAGMQYLGLGLYVAFEAIIFVPLLWIANTFFPGTIQTAGILTLTVFGGLTAAVLLTRQDFSYLRPFLAVGSFLALGFIIVATFVNIDMLGLFFCFAMVALISGFILFQTSNVLHHYRTDQHVAAALALFSSIATLFWYILQIAMMSSRRN
jgi:FtsH-binding integral membrane protein